MSNWAQGSFQSQAKLHKEFKAFLYNINKQMLVHVEDSEGGFPECILTLYHMGSIDQPQVFWLCGSKCLHLLSHLIFPKSTFCMRAAIGIGCPTQA